MLCNLVSRDQRSTTAKNLCLVGELSHQDPWLSSIASIKEGVINAEKVTVSPQDVWRVSYMRSLLGQFQDARSICDEEKMNDISKLVHSLAKG